MCVGGVARGPTRVEKGWGLGWGSLDGPEQMASTQLREQSDSDDELQLEANDSSSDNELLLEDNENSQSDDGVLLEENNDDSDLLLEDNLDDNGSCSDDGAPHRGQYFNETNN